MPSPRPSLAGEGRRSTGHPEPLTGCVPAPSLTAVPLWAPRSTRLICTAGKGVRGVTPVGDQQQDSATAGAVSAVGPTPGCLVRHVATNGEGRLADLQRHGVKAADPQAGKRCVTANTPNTTPDPRPRR